MESGLSENGIRTTVVAPGCRAAGAGPGTTLSACPARPQPADTTGYAMLSDTLVTRTWSSRSALSPNNDRHDQPPVTVAPTATGIGDATFSGFTSAPATETGMDLENRPVVLCTSTTHGHGRGGIRTRSVPSMCPCPSALAVAAALATQSALPSTAFRPHSCS